MTFDTGEVFAGYVIERLLGTGGMGEVYLAQHPRLPRHDALKILSADATTDEEFRARFEREAELTAALWHPHIVSVLDRGEFNGRLWISMEFVDGTDAGRLIRAHPTGLPHSDAVGIVTAVADALDFGHERHLLHRDVKPENILVTAPNAHRRRVLLTDFGIARKIDDVSNITDANVAMGTIDYIAPEQLLGKPLDGRADQYGLAATTFHLLTGIPPFHDSSRAVVASRHLSSPPPRVSDRRPELAHLDAVLAKALAKNPDERYRSCLDFAQALIQQQPAAGGHRTTERLEQLVVRGTAVGVRQAEGQHGAGTLSFHVVPYEPVDGRRGPVPVEISTDVAAGQLADGDDVEVSGMWDGTTVDADTVVNLSTRPPAKPPTRRRAGVLAALIGAVAIAVVIGVALFVTKGFDGSPREGALVEPVSATVFAPGGTPDNPGEADRAIDGDPDTAWSTVTYKDAEPFPTFVEGMGLLLHLPEATALGTVTLDVSSTGTEVQIRSSSSETPKTLADTTELTPTTPLQPGQNTITVADRTETANVLVWITKLGTTDGESRTAISDITVHAAG